MHTRMYVCKFTWLLVSSYGGVWNQSTVYIMCDIHLDLVTDNNYNITVYM